MFKVWCCFDSAGGVNLILRMEENVGGGCRLDSVVGGDIVDYLLCYWNDI